MLTIVLCHGWLVLLHVALHAYRNVNFELLLWAAMSKWPNWMVAEQLGHRLTMMWEVLDSKAAMVGQVDELVAMVAMAGLVQVEARVGVEAEVATAAKVVVEAAKVEAVAAVAVAAEVAMVEDLVEGH